MAQLFHHQEMGEIMVRMAQRKQMRRVPRKVNRPKALLAVSPEAHRARIDPEGGNPERSRGSRRLAFLYERPGGIILEKWRSSR